MGGSNDFPASGRKDLDTIFRAGLKSVDPYGMIHDHVKISGNLLKITLEEQTLEYDLKQFGKIIVLGAGKATAPMAKAMEEILGSLLHSGLIVVKYGHTEKLEKIETIEAGHPVPDSQGIAGAEKLIESAKEADEKTLVFTLISGGGSALLPLPGSFIENGSEVKLTLADKQDTTGALLKCGAEITEVNCVRKHLSAIKGGRLLQALSPATSVNFILSDVVGDDLSSIASGLTAADPTTFDDALDVLHRYGIENDVPKRVLSYLKAGSKEEIPESVKASDPALKKSTNVLMGTNRTALHAATKKAEELGYDVQSLTTRVSGEAKEVAKMLAAIGADSSLTLEKNAKPLCIISGGEPVVTLTGKGKGGRNQEMALAFLLEMKRNPELYDGIVFLAASTDGNDGPTDAAGGFADLEMVARCKAKELNPESFLKNNDSYNLFDGINGLYKTGPTNTNVCDLHIMLIKEKQ